MRWPGHRNDAIFEACRTTRDRNVLSAPQQKSSDFSSRCKWRNPVVILLPKGVSRVPHCRLRCYAMYRSCANCSHRYVNANHVS